MARGGSQGGGGSSEAGEGWGFMGKDIGAGIALGVPQPQGQPARYERQRVLPQMGTAGQERLARAHVAIVGIGALGCVSADLLARAGVGRLTLIDRDVVELSNLQRQPLFDERDAREGLPKAEAARRRLAMVNSDISIDARVGDLTARHAEGMLGLGASGGAGVIVDGTDNFEARYLLNDLAVARRVPLVYAGAVGTIGMQATFTPGGACLRCVFEDPPSPGTQPTCETAGVLAMASGVVASLQATATLRVILGHPVACELFEIDVWSGRTRATSLARAKRPDCPCCGMGRFDYLERRGMEPAVLCGSRSVQLPGLGALGVDLDELAARLRPLGELDANRFLVRLRPREGRGLEITVFADGRALVRGVEDEAQARAAYARYIGA